MRAHKARLVAKTALVTCPLCNWVTHMEGNKTALRRRIFDHIRLKHTEAEIDAYIRAHKDVLNGKKSITGETT